MRWPQHLGCCQSPWLLPSPLGAWAKPRLESSINKFEPHLYIYIYIYIYILPAFSQTIHPPPQLYATPALRQTNGISSKIKYFPETQSCTTAVINLTINIYYFPGMCRHTVSVAKQTMPVACRDMTVEE